MVWMISILGGLISIALVVWGAMKLQRAQQSRSGKGAGVALLVVGCLALVGTVIAAVLASPEQPVGSATHEVEVVSTSGSSRTFYVTLRNVATGEVYQNLRLRERTGSRRGRCWNGARNLHQGQRFVAPFTIWENRDTHVRSEAPNAIEIGRTYC